MKVESKQLVKKSTGDILGAITISIGVAQYQPNETVVDFVRRADALPVCGQSARAATASASEPAKQPRRRLKA